MGGKGRKRREKNYKAAHGAPNRLPPPPAPSSIDALPSKLRKLMSFANSSQSDSVKLSVDTAKKNIGGAAGSHGVEKKSLASEHKLELKTSGAKTKGNDEAEQHVDFNSTEKNSEVEKKKKRKRKPVDDLRFEGDLVGLGSKRKERKKKRLQEMKKKRNKGKVEEDNDFPKRDEIKFGEVVKAPLKLITVPKASKPAHNASTERMRIQAVEAYRERRGWTSRPGLNLPPPDITSPSV